MAENEEISAEERSALEKAEIEATDLLRKTLMGENKDVQLDLADPVLVARLFRTITEDIVAVYLDTCGEDGGDFDASIELMNVVAGGVSMILCGADPRFKTVEGFHPAGLAARLRLIKDAVTEEQAKMEDTAVVTNAVVNMIRDTFMALVKLRRDDQLTPENCTKLIQYTATMGLNYFTEAVTAEEVNKILEG